MYKRYNKRFVVFLFIAVGFIFIGSFYLTSQLKTKNDFLAMKNGEIFLADYCEIGDEPQNDTSRYWRLIFSVGGKKYTFTTLRTYSKAQMESQAKNGKISINYIANQNGLPVLENEEAIAIKIGSTEYKNYYLAKGCESAYLINAKEPTMTTTIFLFFLAGVSLLTSSAYFILIRFYKSVENGGTLAYGVFIEAYASKLGSNRNMALRYKFKNENDEWIEAVSPYTYTIFDIETLKSLDTIRIKYKKNHSVIIEKIA